ncbi:hypothetical protein DS901_02550 [Loktanella sp. D2R18]|nr:hypothetical protein DS901_02550 [Loktanella sp. D2R18]
MRAAFVSFLWASSGGFAFADVAIPIQAEIGHSVTLDPTDSFMALEGGALRAEWSWVERPAVSVAGFSDETALRPTVLVDVNGTYVAQLDLFPADDLAAIEPSYSVTLEISTENLSPVAQISGRSLSGFDAPFFLDGSASYDVDGDALSYSWSVDTVPTSGSATFGSPDAPMTAVSFDGVGFYTLGLTVTDATGRMSVVATYDVDFEGEEAPAFDLQNTLGTFNLVTEQFFGRQQVEGRTYIGSTIDGTNGQFGYNPANDGLDFAELYIDGDVRNGNINLTHGDEARISGVRFQANVNNGTLVENATDLPAFDFDQFKFQSAFLASLTGDTPDLSDQNHKRFGGASNADMDEALFGAQTRVVHTSLQDLRTGGYSIDVSQADTVIINVSGTSGMFQMNPLGGTQSAEHVIWNFYEATSIDINAVIVGHVLAPHAQLRGFSGGSVGTVIAQDVQLTNGPLRQGAWLGEVAGSLEADVTARNVAPVGALFFDQRVQDDTPLTLSALGSTDIDANTLSASFDVLFGDPAILSDVGGVLTVDPTPLNKETLVSVRVSDGVSQGADQVLLVPTGNQVRPQAVATQMVTGTSLVTLDGTQSYDLNGDLLSYSWSLLSQPIGSVTSLNADAPIATFTADVDGRYIAQLIVYDGTAASVPQTIVIDTLAALPVAYAGADQLADAQGSAIVDGGLSSGAVLDFNWSATGLTGADGVFGTPTEMITTVDLSDDGAGEPLPSALQLIVADANGVSLPDTVFVGTGNIRPVVGQGAELTVTGGIATSLLASDYASDLNSDALSYRWSIVSRPDNSVLTVDPADAATQIVIGAQFDFTPDVTGLYLIQLVADDGLLAARPAVISVIVENTAPIAVAAAIADSVVGLAVTLDGSGSSDPDADALNYQWVVTTRPAGSTATIVDPTATVAHFTPDVKGSYSFALTVSDFELSSDPAVTSLTVLNQSPVISIVVPDVITIGEAAVFDASASVDPDGDPLIFTIDVSGPPGSTPQIDELPGGIFGVTADIPGDYTIIVSVSDGEITENSTTTLTAVGANSAPVLAVLLDTYTVELGLELALDLQATDVDGDVLTFYATPLPLVDGASLDANTGAVRFRPEAGQEGSYTFTLGVTDGILTDEAIVTVDAVTGTASDTSVFGRVLDAVDFANGIETPLAGIPVRLDTAALEAITDATGVFRFGSLTEGSDSVTVGPDADGGSGGYVAVQRAINITANQDRDLSPDFLLTSLNEGCVSVLAGQITSLVGTSTGVSLEFAADTILNADGSTYTGQVCLGSLPRQTAQDGFPEDTLACQIYGVSAPGATFSAGALVTAPNYDNLPEATTLTFWENTQSTRFRRVAGAGVDAGASTVSAQVDLNENGMFTFLPQSPRTVASDDQPTGNHTLSVFEGDLNEVYTLPGYFAFNQAQQVGLSYHSSAADPTVIVAGDVTIADDASLPIELSTRIAVGGLSLTSDVTWTPREAADGTIPALVGEEVALRQSMPVDASSLSSGRYDYDFIARAQYDCSTVTATHNADLYVQNETDSPYGVGWSIDGLQELVVADDGSVSIIDDDGIAVFNPEPTLTEFDGDPLVIPVVGPFSFDIGDVDGNGLGDVIVAEVGTGSVSFIYNYGEREFEYDAGLALVEPNEIPATGSFGLNLGDVVTADYDSDGDQDILVGVADNNTVDVLYNDGFGNLTWDPAEMVLGNNTGARAIEYADIDLDGQADIYAPSGYQFLLSRGGRNYVKYGGEDTTINVFGVPGSFFTRAVLADGTLADIDGDGDLDLSYRTSNRVQLIYNEGNRTYTSTSDDIVYQGTEYLIATRHAFLDVDLNGTQDLVISGTSALNLYLISEDRTISDAISIPRPAGTVGALTPNAIDANGDGMMDLLVSGSFSLDDQGPVYVYENAGDGTFLPPEQGFVDHTIGKLAFADLNGDGSLDMVSSQRFSITIDFSEPSESGKFVAGLGEFSTLTKLADGTFERRYKDGMVVVFSADGLQTAEVDPQGNRREYTYGGDGQLTTITDQVGGETTFTYDATGRLASTTYPDGRTTEFTYDDTGTLTDVTEPTGSIVSFEYNDDGQLVSTTNQNGNNTSYSYDAAGKFSDATLPDGSSIAASVAASLGLADGLGNTGPLFYVAPEDRVTTVTDRKGEITEVIVNQFGSPIQTTDPLGRVTRMTRNEDNLVTRIERPSDATADGMRIDTIAYDNNSNVTEMTEAVGTDAERSTQYTYEPEFNQVTSMTDADGFTTAYEYDAFGEVTKVIDPEGGERITAYNAEGKLTQRIDENGNETTYIYNANQNLGQMTYADGSISTMIYDATGNTTAVNEAVGTPIERQVQRTYDALNRVLTVEVTGDDGAQIEGITSYTYEPAGNLATVTDETGLVTYMGYDTLERLVALDDPAEGLIQRTYNDAGEVTEHINGDGEIHAYGYDSVSRLSETTDPEGYVKSFAYDTRNNVTSVIDGRMGETVFGFDVLDRMTTRTNPINQTMTRAYDARDNLDVLIREDGLIETATYDGLSRRTQVVTPDNTLTYAYDARSNLTEAADNDSRVTFTYDLRNRLETTTTDGTVGPQPAATISYTYDALDRRTSMSDSLGGTTTYAYDFEDRLTDLTAPWGTIYSFGYDGEGRRTSLTSTSGRDTSYSYTNGLLSALSHAQSGVALTDLLYSYDVDGQLTAITDTLDPTKSLSINYDDLNRLVQVDQGIPVADGGTPLPIEDYQYDEEGNRLASHLSSLYSSNGHNQLTEDDSYSYAYDERGNRVSRTDKADGSVETYSYDSQNRLIGYASDTTTASYAYDALDRRIAKTVDGQTTTWFRDTEDLGSSTATNGSLEFRGGNLFRRWLFTTEVDEPIAFEQYSGNISPSSGAIVDLYADKHGSVTSATSPATGAVLATYEYDAYGNRLTSTTLVQPYGFIGREHDAEIGTIQLRARDYEPSTGLFLQADVAGFAGRQANLYTYSSNDPVNLEDPSGLVVSTDYRSGVDARQQAAASASRVVADGVFDLMLDLLSNLDSFKNFPTQNVNAISGADGGGSSHCNAKSNQIGNHVYVIYSRLSGRAIKVGIANNKRLLANGTQSARALEQITDPRLQAHSVIIQTPDGFYSRGLALQLEQAMVDAVFAVFGGFDLSDIVHQRPGPSCRI